MFEHIMRIIVDFKKTRRLLTTWKVIMGHLALNTYRLSNCIEKDKLLYHKVNIQ